ncbi:MAG: alpha/beta-type small acid-soluble spore protein [Clostridia bacterium]|nr:alpha/beta-type small acid-soluble spore protein [Clostridia bacterium]
MPRRSNRIMNPQARQALNQMKYEIASQVGVDYNTTGGYLGDIPAREAGRIGGQMVKQMIAAAEQSLIGQTVAGAQASFSQALGPQSSTGYTGGAASGFGSHTNLNLPRS